MANRLSSVQSLFPVMRPELVLLWCNEDRNTRRIEPVHFQDLAAYFVDKGEANVLYADETFMLIAS